MRLAKTAFTRTFALILLLATTLNLFSCGKPEDETLIARAKELSEKYSGKECKLESGSTDCNVPMSLGVPAVCVGTHLGGGAHTREERVQKGSVLPGLLIVTELILDYFN